ncbi:MAG: 3-phosphoshikimate 1-carboxyvinyltransferase [Acidobacteriota bacterium]
MSETPTPESNVPLYGPVPADRTASGRLAVPGSKSLTQRYFALALVARRRLTIRRPLDSEDIHHFLGALRSAGFRVEWDPSGDVHLDPGPAPVGDGIIDVDCGAGGTMLRFLTAALTVVPGRYRLDGIPRLRERTVEPLVRALRQLEADLRGIDHDGFAPLSIEGRSLRGGRCRLDAGASSQFLSALLIAGIAAPEPIEIEIEALTSEPYVDLTLDAIAELGGRVTRDDSGPSPLFRVEPGLTDGLDDVRVEADFSSVAYPAAAAALTRGEVFIESVSPDSRQGDRAFVDLLAAMGAQTTWRDGGLAVVGGPLRAVTADLSATPDQVPTLAALAPFADGVTRIENVPHLRIKESDRLAAMASELRRVGAEVEELDDGLVIPGVWAKDAPPTTPVEVDTWNDHRIGMAMALVGLRRPGVVLRHPAVVDKSYPNFWRDLEHLIRT